MMRAQPLEASSCILAAPVGLSRPKESTLETHDSTCHEVKDLQLDCTASHSAVRCGHAGLVGQRARRRLLRSTADSELVQARGFIRAIDLSAGMSKESTSCARRLANAAHPWAQRTRRAGGRGTTALKPVCDGGAGSRCADMQPWVWRSGPGGSSSSVRSEAGLCSASQPCRSWRSADGKSTHDSG